MRKYAPYILILLVLVGLFSPMVGVHAQNTAPATPASSGICTSGDDTNGHITERTTKAECDKRLGNWDPNSTATPTVGGSDSGLAKQIPGCAVITGDFDDCIIKITYIIFYTIPAFLLGLAADFFNLVISLTLSSALYTKSSFIPEAWGVVRDLSNIFFILVLLYIAIKTILGLGGSDVKKMVAQVIIMALLINFSMFFSEIIIDSSNILALVFYNKINVETKIGTGTDAQTRFYTAIGDQRITNVPEKDIAGGIVSKFDPSRMMTAEFFEKARTQTQVVASWSGAGAFVAGGALAGSAIPFVGTAIGAGVGAAGYIVKTAIAWAIGSKDVPVPLMLGIILVSGLTMAFAAYSFFVVGLAFISRLIELWVLIIFSPFAFMSSSVPFLSKAEGIGWDEWIKSIVRVSFMAPFFMFFLYLIFKLINADLFTNISIRTFEEQSTLEAILLMTLPALVVLIILHKATKKAQKWSGELGEMVIHGTEIAMGITAGLGLGLVASAGQAGLGKYGRQLANSDWVKEKGALGRGLGRVGGYFAGASFDARKGIIGGVLSAAGGISGLNLGSQGLGSKILVKDSYDVDRKKQEQRRLKRNEAMKVSEDENLKQDLNNLERTLQELLRNSSHQIGQLDLQIAAAEKASNAAAAALRAETPGTTAHGTAQTAARNAAANVIELRRQKSSIKNAVGADFAALSGAATAAEGLAAAATAAAAAGTGTAAAAATANVAARSARAAANVAAVGSARSINNLEDTDIPDAKNAIQLENRNRAFAEAERIRNGGGRVRNFFRAFGIQQAGDNAASRRAAAHKIIMEEKLDSGNKQ